MAEALGALAAVLAITECTSKAASLVFDYYKAPAQIIELQVRFAVRYPLHARLLTRIEETNPIVS